jgi:hypothetical protein
MITQNPLLSEALACAQRGWRVFPVHSIRDDRRCSCSRAECAHPGKHPCVVGWPEAATTDPEILTRWWAIWPYANVGVLTGGGLAVLDVDPRNGGDTSLAALEQEHGPLPSTITCRTGGGGQHFYFSADGLTVRSNTSGVLGKGLDVKAGGGFVVAPPSTHISGRAYAWDPTRHPDQTPLAPLPDWMAARLAKSGAVPSHTGAPPLPEIIPMGQRNTFLLSLGGSMRHRGATEEEIAAALLVANRARCQPPLSEAEVRDIARSVARYTPAPTEQGGIKDLVLRGRLSAQGKRRLSALVRDDLLGQGNFYRVVRTGELFYFFQREKKLYSLEAAAFRALCNEQYGLNGTEPLWKFILEDLLAFAIRQGTETEIFLFARYHHDNGGVLYVHLGGQQVWRLDGRAIATVHNGTDGILFLGGHHMEPVAPEFHFAGSPVRELVVNIANAVSPARLGLYHCFIYSLFFESILPTKPVLLLVGPKGSAKTSTGRAVKCMLFGPGANVDIGAADREDAFWASVCNSYLLCLDNVDGPGQGHWLGDAIAVVATGGTFKRRKLYETNTLVEYVPRCFLMLTSRDPGSFFRRDDVADRLLLIEVDRRQEFIEESRLLTTLHQRRPELWGELLTTLNQIVAALAEPRPPQRVPFRLADWVRLVTVMAPILGIDNMTALLRDLEADKSAFVLEGEVVLAAIQRWTATHPDHDWISTGDLYDTLVRLYQDQKLDWPFKSARGFGAKLKNLRPDLESRFSILQRAGAHNVKLWQFRPLSDAGQEEF